MKILYLQAFPLYGSGSGTYARSLAQEVAKRHTVAMVVPDSRSIEGVKMYPVKLQTKIAFTGHPEWPDCKLYIRAQGHDLASSHLAYFQKIVEAVDDFKPDIIHVHHLMPLAWIARFIRISYGINYIVTAHGSELPTLESDKRYPSLTKEALTRAKRIVSNSYWTRDWMRQIFGDAFDHRLRVIPGGVDFSEFPSKMETASVDEKYKLKGKKLILFSGKLTPYKGVRYLIMASKYINGVIGIAGDGPQRKALEELTQKNGIANVKFFGHLKSSDLIKLYYRADVCVVPSIWDEPLGLVILEAMAARTPVVVTRKGGIPLMVKEGVNGLFIRPHNPKDIAEKVNLLLHDNVLLEKIGERARQTVKEKFTWSKIAKQYERMYKQFTNPSERKKVPKPAESFVLRSIEDL